MDLTSSNPTMENCRKLVPAKTHKQPTCRSPAAVQLGRLFELYSAPAVSIPLKCMIVLSILARAQLIRSLAFSPAGANTFAITNNLTSPVGPGGADSGNGLANPTQASNGTYNQEVSELFNDLSTISDNYSKAEPDNATQRTLTDANVSAVDAALEASPANLDVSSGPQEADDNSLIISIIATNILIFIIGFCGNSLVILVILRFTRIETVTDIYILNLAFADLMFLFGLIFLIITMFIDHWIFGTLMCKLYMASTSLNQFASSLLLVVMSFDRFLAVCHPIYAQRFRRLKRAKVICFCIWITCLILMTPIFAFAKTNKELTCAIFWPEYNSFNCEIAFTLYSFGIGFAVPLLLIAAFYTCVIRKLRIAASGPISLGSTRRSRTRETTNKRIEHLVIGIICTYTVCWLPYWVSQLCVSFTTTLDRSPIEGFYPFVLVATCLSYTNSALNPILYAFLSDNFKRRCTEVFRSIYSVTWCQRPQSQDTHSTAATALCDHSEVNNNHANNLLRAESRQTVVMNESVRLMSSPGRHVETHILAPMTTDQMICSSGLVCDSATGKLIQDCQSSGSKTNLDNGGQGSQHVADGCFGLSQQDHANICNHSRTKSSNNDLRPDGQVDEVDTVNRSNTYDNPARRKSVAFSTIVVQGPNNNGQIVKSDHKMLQVTDKKIQQDQGAV